MCYGSVTAVHDTYLEAYLDSTPMGKMAGSRRFNYIFTPGLHRYRDGDRVAVMLSFMYDTYSKRVVGENAGIGGIVIGRTPRTSTRAAKIINDTTSLRYDDDCYSFTHFKNGAGLVTLGDGSIKLGTTSPSLKSEWNIDGKGIYEDSIVDTAKNYHRMIMSDCPIETAREHFGYSGSEGGDSDCTYIYRRYVASDKTFEKFTTVCEGAFNPFMGPNNSDDDELDNSRETVYYRVVQNGKIRATIDIGDTDDFFNIRIDKIILDEMAPTGKALPSVMGNLAQFKIDKDGNFSLLAGAKGTPMVAMHDFVLKFKDGDTELHSKGKITLAHGKGSDAMNSIVMDPKAGIDVTAFNGFRVNGKAVVTEDYLAWMQKNVANFGLGNMGAPVPIFPAALTPLLLGIKLPQVAGGFTTMNKGAPAIGVNVEPDTFVSV